MSQEGEKKENLKHNLVDLVEMMADLTWSLKVSMREKERKKIANVPITMHHL